MIGIDKIFVDAMPFLSDYLFNLFQYNISKRELMFFNKLEYLMGKTEIIPENTFEFPKLRYTRSFLEDRIASFLNFHPTLSLKKGVYYKGYEIDLLVASKDQNN